MTHTLRIAAMISGGGRTLMNLADEIDAGTLPAKIVLVIASRENIVGVEKAQARGFDVRIADPRKFGSREEMDRAITRWLREKEVDLVCLCGWLRLLRIDDAFVGRVINIHPALLPDFGGAGMYGEYVHRAVLQSGRDISGCTVHFVDDQYDHGPTILQRTCAVEPDDTPESLAARVFEQECIAYPEAIRMIADGRVAFANGRVEISSDPLH